MADLARREENTLTLHEFDNGQKAELKTYSPVDVVLRSNKIEVHRNNEGTDAAAKIMAGYILQANALLAENQRMPLNQIVPVCKQLLDGVAWSLTFEELSNIILAGIQGTYGNLYRLDMPSIGRWITTYLREEQAAIYANKQQLREAQREASLNTMGEGHIRLFREVLKEDKPKAKVKPLDPDFWIKQLYKQRGPRLTFKLIMKKMNKGESLSDREVMFLEKWNVKR